MSIVSTSRKYHKWLMLFLGVQFVIWTISGAYMVIFDIDYIHGDTLVVNHQTKIDANNVSYPLAKLYQRYPDAKNIEVVVFIDQVVYRFEQESKENKEDKKNKTKQKYIVNASTGETLSPINEKQAVKAAKHYYTGAGEVIDVTLITENPPFELSARALPAWRVNFKDFGSPSIYVSAQTGRLVTKRHEFWRTFDLMFSLHVMDYEDEDPSNQLLFWFTLFSIIAAIFGAILSYFVIFKSTASKPLKVNSRGAK